MAEGNLSGQTLLGSILRDETALQQHGDLDPPPGPDPPDPPDPPATGAGVLFIKPTVQGTGSGTSWTNAGSFADLSVFVTNISLSTATDRTIYLGATNGSYTGINTMVQTLTAGGSHSNALIVNNSGTFDSNGAAGTPWQEINPSLSWEPIKIQGVTEALVATKVILVGSRLTNLGVQWTPAEQPAQMISWLGQTAILDIMPRNRFSWTLGGRCIRFSTGSQDLWFDNIYFQHMEAPFTRNGSVTVTNLKITNCQYLDVRYFYECAEDPGGINGLHMADITGQGHSKPCIEIRGGANQHFLFEDMDLDSYRIVNDNFAMGWFFDGVHDVTCIRCVGRNHTYGLHDSETGDYWNGDSFVIEGISSDGYTTERIQTIDCEAHGDTDGGIDIKALSHYHTRFTANNCKRNFRTWQSGTFTDCVSLNPFKRGGTGGANHYYANQSDNVTTLINPTSTDGSAPFGAVGFQVNDGATINASSPNGVVSTAFSGTPTGTINIT